MIKNKISPNLLNVNILSSQSSHEILVDCDNFYLVKKFLDTNKYSYQPYRFINSFLMKADIDDINILSNLSQVNYIHANNQVLSHSLNQDFMHLDRLTEGKFFGQGQTICIIDTGIHPHFDFVLPKNKIVKFIDLINGQNSPYDDNGHGTFVSGIACGNGILSKNNIGYAKLANIVSIKALSDKGNSNSNKILDAMEWIYQNHKKYNIGIVCMSFGADCEVNLDPLSKGAEALWKKGIIVVAAAGNSGPNQSTIKSPGVNPNIITVGGLDINNVGVAEFSSRGPTIYGHKPDLLAPAVDIISCSNLHDHYTKMSGTSVATPIIAGICAIIKSKYPYMNNVDVKNFLLSHCTPISHDIDTEGAGYINF